MSRSAARSAPAPREAHTLGNALIEALHAHGAREVFGIPGDYVLPFFDALESSARLPLYTLSHEPAVGFAADAAARIRGDISVAAVTYGAGALNMLNAVAAAYAEKSPVVVVSGGPGARERSAGMLVHHQVRTLDSQLHVFREVTCAQARLDDPERAPAEIARVLAAARRLARPVYIELPRDMCGAPCARVQPEGEPGVDADAVDACAREVLERLASSRRPVMMIGVEVRRFGLEGRIAALAERLGVPVVTSFMGRGLLASTQAPLVGTYAGAAGDPQVARLVEDSDGLLLLGVIVSDTNFGVSTGRVDLRRAIHAFDRTVTLSHHVYPEIPLQALIEALLALAQPLGAAVPVPASQPPRGLPEDAVPISPLDIAAGVNDLMAEHGAMPVSADVGDSLFVAMDLQPSDYVAPGYYAGMGFGVPGALGVQAATGRRPIAIVGDGAFQMTGLELGHCARYGWDPIVVVLNNGGWGMLSAFRPDARYTGLGHWDLAGVARALGGEGTCVHTRAELKQALASAARERGRFHLIDARLAPDALSARLRRFAQGLG